MENSPQIFSASVTDKGLSEKRPQNEDSFLEIAQSGIYAVADGVGGAEGGEVASQMAMEILGEAFANKPDGSDVEDVMKNAIESANSAIFQMSHEVAKLDGMATTIVALHVSDNVATIGHVGDSRLYRVDPAGKLHRETEDHSMVADEVRAGRMTEEQAENHPSRNVINRALGAEPLVEVDLKTILIEPETTFLLCSDGITRHVNDDEIEEILNTESEPNGICSYLKDRCYERGAEDNLTAVVVKVTVNTMGTAASTDQLADDEEDTLATAREFAEADTFSNVVETEAAPRSQSDKVGSDTGGFLSLDQRSHNDESESGMIKKVAAGIGLLLLGCLFGAGIYHFAFSPTAPKTQIPQLSEMKSDNIALTSFEKLRRTVDADPAAYLKEVPPAQDAEDFYLLGRACLLTGDYVKARSSLLEAQKLLANTDASNSKVLAADIAAALVIANDPEMQKRFKGEIENTAKSLANSSVNR